MYTPRQKFSVINGELSGAKNFWICQKFTLIVLFDVIKSTEDAEALEFLNSVVVLDTQCQKL